MQHKSRHILFNIRNPQMKNWKSLVTKETNSEWLAVFQRKIRRGRRKIMEHRLNPTAGKDVLCPGILLVPSLFAFCWFLVAKSPATNNSTQEMLIFGFSPQKSCVYDKTHLIFHFACGPLGISNFALKGCHPKVHTKHYFLPKYLFAVWLPSYHSWNIITLSIAPIHDAHPDICHRIIFLQF